MEESNIKVIKRDGRKVDFDKRKIVNAILEAFRSTDGEITNYSLDKANNISNYIKEFVEKKKKEGIELNIEEIQDLVEKGLMSTKRKDVAREYILYRDKRNRERQKNSPLNKMIKESLLSKETKNQNANVDEKSFGGRLGTISSEVMKQYALDYCMSEMARNNHINNRIYIHDLDHYAIGDHNCLTIPFDKLLAEGFNTRQTDVRPAQSVSTAFQLIAVIFQLQSLQQFGGVSASHLDWTMIPYVRKSFNKHFIDGIKYILELEASGWEKYKNISIDSKDYRYYNKKVYKYAMDKTIKEVYQAVEGMYHNLKNWA